MRSIRVGWLVALVALTASGCSLVTGFSDLSFDGELDTGPIGVEDSGPDDEDLGRPRDAGADARVIDDSGPRDSGPRDSGTRDSGMRDLGPTDAGADTGTDARDGGDRDAGPTCVDESGEVAEISVLEEMPPSLGRHGIIAYKVRYSVGDLLQYGQICVPQTPGRHPIALYNHGGTEGLAGQWGIETGLLDLVPNICTFIAQQNLVAVMPQFRGQSDEQGASGGDIEYCQGEVDDAEELLRIAALRCDTDATRIVALGHEQGACVTLRLVPRTEPPMRAAVAIAGPTDLLQLAGAWSEDVDRAADYATLLEAVGTDPNMDPAPWRERSPIAYATSIAEARVPLMLIHGTMDEQIPIAQLCAFRDALHSAGTRFSNFHVNRLGNAVESPIGDCMPDSVSAYIVPWPPPAAPDRFGGDDYFLAFDQAHAFDVGASSQAYGAYLDFLVNHLD